MSDHTRASYCPNVVRVGDTTLFADHWEVAYDPDPPDLNGWKLVVGDHSYNTSFPTQGSSLAPETYEGPNGERVWVLNSSEYASVCENDWVVFGQNRDHVRAFITACGFAGIRIEPLAIVMQTL